MTEKMSYGNTGLEEYDELIDAKQQHAEQKLADYRNEANPPSGADAEQYLNNRNPSPYEHTLIMRDVPGDGKSGSFELTRGEIKAMAFALDETKKSQEVPDRITGYVLELVNDMDPSPQQPGPTPGREQDRAFQEAIRFTREHTGDDPEKAGENILKALEEMSGYGTAAKLGQALTFEGYRTEDPELLLAGEQMQEMAKWQRIQHLVGEPQDSNDNDFLAEGRWMNGLKGTAFPQPDPFENPSEAAQWAVSLEVTPEITEIGRELGERAQFTANGFLAENTLHRDMQNAGESAVEHVNSSINIETPGGHDLARALGYLVRNEIYSDKNGQYQEAAGWLEERDRAGLESIYAGLKEQAGVLAGYAQEHPEGLEIYAGPMEMTNQEALDYFDQKIESLPPGDGSHLQENLRETAVDFMRYEQSAIHHEMEQNGPNAQSGFMAQDTETSRLAAQIAEIARDLAHGDHQLPE